MGNIEIVTRTFREVTDDLHIKGMKGSWEPRYISEIEGEEYKSYEDVEMDNVCVFMDDKGEDVVYFVVDTSPFKLKNGHAGLDVEVYYNHEMIHHRAISLVDFDYGLEELCKFIEKKI